MAVNFKTARKPVGFLGLDTSTSTGLVVLDTNGEVIDARNIKPVANRTRQKVKQVRNPYDRLNAARTELEGVLDTYAIKGICIEKYAFNLHGKVKQSPDSIITQVRFGEMYRETLYNRDQLFTEVTPNQLKKYATGKGQGKKEEILLGVFKSWGLEFPTNDQADAYVLARMAYHLNSGTEAETQLRQKILDAVESADYNVCYQTSKRF